MVFNTRQHATRPRAVIGNCTLLKRCTHDLEFWYQDALQFFAKFFSPIESEWLKVCLWYAMTESILQQMPALDPPEVYGCILQDLKEKLGESQIEAELILQQVLNRSVLYQQVVAEYSFDGGIATMGYHWPPWQKWHTHAELLELSERALPFWVFHAPYAARFAECWTAYHAIALHTCTPSPPKEFSLEELLQTANYLARNSHKPLCELLASPTVSGSKRGVCTDREAMFFSLLKSGVPFRQAGIIVGKSCHQADYGPGILSTLSCMRLERSTQRALAGGFYLPPRARAARKVLQLLELY